MRLKMILVAVLCFAAQGATAQSLEQIAGKSAFVREKLRALKRNDAASVYASTKPYCPSGYWYTDNIGFNKEAKAGYRKTVRREMKQAGFPAQAIKHCVDNSGFIYANYRLRAHPKNTSYLSHVQSGIMVFRKKDGGAISSAPVLAEVSSYGKKIWRVYNASFKEICVITETDPDIKVKINCGAFGALSGHWTYAGGRSTITGSNGGYDVVFVTRRPASYAKKIFRKTFGG